LRPMRIAIIGAGSLGSALGARLGGAGHEIMFGGEDSAREVASRMAAGVGSNSDAAAFGDVVVLAVPFAAMEAALDGAGTEGRVLWSCVNALTHDLSGLAVGFDTSGAERVAQQAPGARVVAAIPPFAHAIASGTLAYDEGLTPSVFLCGDDRAAKEVVERLVRDLGAHPVDAGPLSAARLVEPAMTLLIGLAYSDAPRDLGLRLLERTSGSGSGR
jgi:8-hydroxy-5-deazaflavin:NADPH oxidoreductase